jgi:hypothetical protein
MCQQRGQDGQRGEAEDARNIVFRLMCNQSMLRGHECTSAESDGV